MGDLGLWTVFGSEVVGTAVLILLGTGVVANVSPARTYGTGGGVGVITLGWGLGGLRRCTPGPAPASAPRRSTSAPWRSR